MADQCDEALYTSLHVHQHIDDTSSPLLSSPISFSLTHPYIRYSRTHFVAMLKIYTDVTDDIFS